MTFKGVNKNPPIFTVLVAMEFMNEFTTILMLRRRGLLFVSNVFVSR